MGFMPAKSIGASIKTPQMNPNILTVSDSYVDCDKQQWNTAAPEAFLGDAFSKAMLLIGGSRTHV